MNVINRLTIAALSIAHNPIVYLRVAKLEAALACVLCHLPIDESVWRQTDPGWLDAVAGGKAQRPFLGHMHR